MKFNINQDLGVNIFKSLKSIHHHCHTSDTKEMSSCICN